MLHANPARRQHFCDRQEESQDLDKCCRFSYPRLYQLTIVAADPIRCSCSARVAGEGFSMMGETFGHYRIVGKNRCV